MKILIVRLSAVGDVIRALPVLAGVRARVPDARVAWLVEDRAASLLIDHPGLDGLFVYPRRRWSRALRRPWLWPRLFLEYVRFRRALRAEAFDVSIDLQGNLKSGFLVRAARAARRIGFAKGESKEGNHLFQTETVDVPEGPLHKRDRGLTLLTPLGEPVAPLEPVAVAISDQERAAVDAYLEREGLTERPFVVLHPGTSAWAAFKAWPPERYASLAAWIRDELGLTTIVTHGPGEEALARRVANASQGSARVADALPGLGALASLVERSAAVVGADTGPVHLAAALDTPTVALFGPKDPALYAPFGASVEIVWNRVPCSPCSLRWCPDPICMTTMDEAPVRDALRRLL